jgi:F0F1-type ATP synthase assembly protein I
MSDVESAWTVVIEFATAVAVYGALGWFADKWLHTGHVLFFGGLILGMVLGIYLMVKKLDHAESEIAARKREARQQAARAQH